jgi:hypothetical protein
MGQQPRVDIGEGERPRRSLDTAPAVHWRSDKPGIPQGPADVPRGGAFGAAGSDPGWAWRVVRGADLPDDDPRLRLVLVGLVMARAAALGRAAVSGDVDAALALCGYGSEERPDSIARRRRWLEATAHETRPGATAVAEVDRRLLIEKPERIRWADRHSESA